MTLSLFQRINLSATHCGDVHSSVSVSVSVMCRPICEADCTNDVLAALRNIRGKHSTMSVHCRPTGCDRTELTLIYVELFNNNNNNNNTLIYIAPACRMTSEALADSSSSTNKLDECNICFMFCYTTQTADRLTSAIIVSLCIRRDQW